jgi:3-keto-5-aminohexanoate cleavage enzyme
MSSLWIKDNFNFERPCMITCALSGVVANRAQCPAIPYAPEEYAAEAKRACEAGAAVVHIHARKPDGTPSYEVADYRNIYDAGRRPVRSSSTFPPAPSASPSRRRWPR